MIELAKGAKRIILEYKLSRYACYLIVQNSDPSKEVVALSQTYFVIQTRHQELIEKEYSELTKDEKKFYQNKLVLKTLISFIMLVIKDYIMEKQQMILLKEKN